MFAAPSSYRRAASDLPSGGVAPPETSPYAPPAAAPSEPPSGPPFGPPVFGPPPTAPPSFAAPGHGGVRPLASDGTLLQHVPAPPVPSRRRRALSAVWIAPLVAVSLLAGFLGGLLGGRVLPDDGRRVDAGLPVVAAPGTPVDRAPESVAGIAAGVLPSVVSIEVTSADGLGSGSGFVLRQDGYVLTNNHVVAGAGDGGLVVQFADGTELPGTVVGATAEYDLAVVKVEATGLTPLALGDSDAVVVGDPVVAIGAPLGLVGTVTTGIVSALNRPVVAGEADDAAFINAIQTDAAINPGNSGGPLVNARGEVVGINSAIAQLPGRLTSAGSIGLGFAIPSNQARRTAEQLIETGRAVYPVIGVVLDPEYSGEGVRVFEQDPQNTRAVTPDGPADRAGIRRGDVILEIDGRPVTASEELIVAIRARQPGDTVVLRVRTGEDEREVRVRLDEGPTG
ncbi:trypsin-like peptidase domain-containing protein [Cellulomonas sp. S1-8]|nr:trypsin-like peptidase domain-containing protein [Cellulomonas sp. S1-8]